MQEVGSEDVRRRDQELNQLRDAARQLGVDKLRDGTWFRRIVAAHVKKHCADDHGRTTGTRSIPASTSRARARKQIRGVVAPGGRHGAVASIGAELGRAALAVHRRPRRPPWAFPRR